MTSAPETLIYLPGLDGTGRLLHRQPALHREYDVRCVAYPQDDRHTYEDLVALALDHLDPLRPAIILAESFGGAVALRLALERPDLVQRLVLVNTFAYFPRRPIINLMAWVGPHLPARPAHPATHAVRTFFFSKDIPARERKQLWERTADVPMSAFGQRFQLIQGLDLRPRLGAIHIPTLIVAAPDDRVVPACAGRALARLLPNARLISPDVGHAALIHPKVDVAELLANPDYWPERRAAEMPVNVL